MKAKVWLWPHDIGLSTVYDIKKQKDQDQLQLFVLSSESVKDFFKLKTLKQPKWLQFDKSFYK